MNDPASDLSRLELPPEEMRRLGYRVIDMLVDHHAGLHDKPVAAVADPETLAARLSEPPPDGPGDPHALLAQLERDVLGHMMFPNHPRFFAFIPGPGNYVGVLGDAIAAGYNMITTLWMESSGPSALELATVDWVRSLLGFPEGAGGLFVSGGTVANLTGLAVARRVHLADRVDGAVVYCTDQTHASLRKALDLLGIRGEQVRRVPVDAGLAMDAAALATAIQDDRAAGRRPFCVIATAGTTNTGAADPLAAIAVLCREQDLWMHVDGAYGAAAAITARGREALAGMEQAHSLAFDPHKWLFQPFEIGCTLVRDARWLPRTFSENHEYLQGFSVQPGSQAVNFCDHGIQLTRTCRAVKLWLTVKTFGMDAIRAAVERTLDNAERAESMLRAAGCFEVTTPASLGIVSFRYVSDGGLDDAALDRINAAMVEACMAEGYAMLSSTRLHGRTVLRLCTINPRTTEADLAGTVERLAAYGQRAVERAQPPTTSL